VDTDGSAERLLADVANYIPSPGASNSTAGAANVSWSQDGAQVVYTLMRAGGSGMSGLGVVDVATGSYRRLHGNWADSGMFIAATWLPDGRIALGQNRGLVILMDVAAGAELPGLPLGQDRPWPAILHQPSDGSWLAGGVIEGQEIFHGPAGAMREIARGVSPTLAPDQQWVAYFKGESIRLVRIEGTDDRELIDLTQLGGRDRHFAGTPDCFPGYGKGCSYRPPMLSWAGP
jgi:hypothetical protein